MAVPAARANQVADAVVARLVLLKSAFNAELHHHKPALVERGILPHALSTAARPVYMVQVGSYRRTNAFARRHTFDPLRISIHIVVEDAEDVDSTLAEAVRDVEFQLEGDERLGGLVNQMLAIEADLSTEVMLTHQIGYALVHADYQLTTDHTAP